MITTEDTPKGSSSDERDSVAFVLRLGRALHSYGYAAHRLEEVLGLVAARLGLLAQFFSTPTSIFAAFGPQDCQRTHLIRVEPGEVDLGKLAEVDHVSLRVLHGQITPGEGSRLVDGIVAAPARYGAAVTVLAFALVSGSAARFLGGGGTEVLVASIVGLMIGLLAQATGPIPTLGRVFEPVAAFLASALASVAAHGLGGYSVFIATLGGLIVLIPGLTLTIGMTELSSRHLVSGVARLSGAFMVFLGIAFGVALGSIVVSRLLGPVAVTPPVGSLPAWSEYLALVAAPLAVTVLFRAAARDAVWIVMAGILAIYGSRIGGALVGPELGVFLGALVVGVASNLYAWRLDRPAAVTLVPGLLLLVPGSIGFRSLASLLDQEVVLGVEAAFKMILIGAALVAGILIANVVTPARITPRAPASD